MESKFNIWLILCQHGVNTGSDLQNLQNFYNVHFLLISIKNEFLILIFDEYPNNLSMKGLNY
jgi:hypothetical protein